MSDNRYPMLDLVYQQYLTDESSASFLEAVTRKYSIGTLERLATFGGRVSRRAAILAIGFLGDYSSNEIMGKAMVDRDRGVRLLADRGIREIWLRQGSPSQQQALQAIYRYIEQFRNEDAVDAATSLINVNPDISEAWSQRAVAYSADGEFEAALEDCHEALSRNKFHYPAALGVAHCYMNLDNVFGALEGFRMALKLNPDLDGVRNHIMHLERSLEDS